MARTKLTPNAIACKTKEQVPLGKLLLASGRWVIKGLTSNIKPYFACSEDDEKYEDKKVLATRSYNLLLSYKSQFKVKKIKMFPKY